MPRNILLACCFVYLLVLGPRLQAEVLSDLYSAQVKVASQSQGALATGAREALGQVLVKASGSPNILKDSELAESLRNARNAVQQYAYERRPGSEPGEEELWARFEFSPSYVTSLLKSIGAPLWTANRPKVLVWLVLDDPEKGRYFANEEAAPEVTAELFQAFSHRGVPAKIPLFDLADTAALSLDEAWQMQSTTAQAASSRYDLENIVLARVAQVSDGNFVGDFSYLRGDQRMSRSITGATLADFLQQGVGLVADDMARRFAVAANDVQSDGLLVSVFGIENYNDYASVISWLESLELVDDATVQSLGNEKMVLRLKAQADAVQLASLIELNRRLKPVPADALNPRLATGLNYQWRR